MNTLRNTITGPPPAPSHQGAVKPTAAAFRNVTEMVSQDAIGESLSGFSCGTDRSERNDADGVSKSCHKTSPSVARLERGVPIVRSRISCGDTKIMASFMKKTPAGRPHPIKLSLPDG